MYIIACVTFNHAKKHEYFSFASFTFNHAQKKSDEGNVFKMHTHIETSSLIRSNF